MGFSHERLRIISNYRDGGAIEVEANGAKGHREPQDEIREHLSHIMQDVFRRNFEAPMFIHDQEVPPGITGYEGA